MVTSSIIEHLFSDKISLLAYSKGEDVSFMDVARRLSALDRSVNKNIPDHYYILNKENSLDGNGIDSLSSVLVNGLFHIADKYLELRKNIVYIKHGKQLEWQKLITRIPPLVLISAYLAPKSNIDINSISSIQDFYQQYIYPNTKYTALPNSYLPQLDTYVNDNNGLHDLHMHLNGTTETDVAWQDFLYNPDGIYSELINEGYGHEMTREQFEEEAGLLNPKEFLTNLKGARKIRELLFFSLFPQSNNDTTTNYPSSIAQILGDPDLFPSSIYHPFYSLIYNEEYDIQRDDVLLSIESLMYIFLFRYLKEKPDDNIASMFHYYLLVLGLSNRLLVQQVPQYGFRQFQKITVNELRSTSEKAYRKRFFQLHGNEMRNVRLLEGRFSPKDTKGKMERLLSDITKGWKVLSNDIKAQLGVEENNTELPQLRLIAHFIKQKEKEKDDEIRHKKLRYDLWNKAMVLSYMKRNGVDSIKSVCGIDAASSEFDAPPEVFAPAYRMLRRNGFQHFTYHAGEDFFHLIGGLRAIYEAVKFNGLEAGDRIGHATASGVSPKLWCANIGSKMLIRKGEYLDDLIFAYHLIIEQKIKILEPRLPFVINRIHELSYDIYGQYYGIKVLEDAWLLRSFCPIIIRTLSRTRDQAWPEFDDGQLLKKAEESSTFDYDEWCLTRDELKFAVKSGTDEKVGLYKMYHSKDTREKYEKIFEIETIDIFSCEDLECLQLSILCFLHDKEIVIETLPTSNIRIGHHTDFSSYHLWNWLRWEEDGNSIPPIVVGTDDAGIFATNIYNEFANIYYFLTSYHNLSHFKAMSILKQFEENARIYTFDS